MHTFLHQEIITYGLHTEHIKLLQLLHIQHQERLLRPHLALLLHHLIFHGVQQLIQIATGSGSVLQAEEIT